MKKSYLLTTVLFLFLTCSSFAQTYVIQAKPLDSKEWGYINLDGNFIIDAQYRKCYEFSEEGYAPIFEKEEGYFFINIQGETLQTEIPGFALKEVFGVTGFDEGLAPVRINENWGYLNTDGKLAIPAKYSKVSSFKDGYAIAQVGSNFYIIDKQGNEKLVEVPGVTEIKHFSENLAPYKTENGLYGFINANANVVIEARFVSVGYFNAGLAWAKTNVATIGYLNPAGEWVIQPQIFITNDFDPETELAKVKHNEKWIYLNTKGEIIQFDDSETISEFHEGLAKGKKNEKIGFYNSNMEWVIQPQFDGVRNFKNGYAAAKLEDKWGIIDKTGSWVIQPVFAALKDVEKVN